MLFGALRGDLEAVTRTVAWLILLVGSAALMCWGLLSLGAAGAEVALAVTVLGGSALTLGFAFAPLMGGVSDPLDPRRFALLALPKGPLAFLLAVAGLISVPMAALLAVAVSAAVMWGEHGVPGAAGAASVVLIVLTCLLVARVCMALTSLFLRERRSRELSGVFVLVILIVVVPVGVFLTSLEWDGRVPTQLLEAVRILGVTPIGASWAFPGLIADGGDAVLSVVVAVLTVVGLGALWAFLVHRLLTTTERPASVRERGGLGWFTVTPGTPGGAVAARSLFYWLRDPRYLVNVAVIPVAAAVTIVPLLIAGVPPELVALVPVPFMALFLGWLPHNDVAYDSTAIWMHVAAGVRGFADRLGRLVPVLSIGVPLLIVAIPVAIVFHGRWAMLPAMIGVCASLFLSALGLSSISSALAPYAVSRPGESPFEQPQRVGATAAIAQSLVLAGAIVVSLPTLWWGWLAIGGEAESATTALWAGLGTGLAVFAIGVGIGSALFERRGDRIIEFAEAV